MAKKPKPEGPIYIDNTELLVSLPIKTLIHWANCATNQLTSRQIGEIAFECGVDLKVELHESE